MTPHIFIVPGLYEGPAPFDSFVQHLQQEGYPQIHIAKIASLGTSSDREEGIVTLNDDIASIKNELVPFIANTGDDGVVLVVHSAGGFLGSGAMEGLSSTSHRASGRRGGISQLICFTAALLPVGAEHQPLPFMKFNVGILECLKYQRNDADSIQDERTTQSLANPDLLFHDLPESEATKWKSRLPHHPGTGRDQVIEYAGWQDVSVDCIVANLDQVIPRALQEQFASAAKAKVHHIEAGHMAQLSQPADLSCIVAGAIKAAQ